MSEEQLNEIYKLWLKGEANLYGADLSEANLSRADLYGADLHGADLRGANLYGADLYGADLREADLRGADLREANLNRANLNRADLSRADLRGADLRGADLDFSCWPLWCGTKEVKLCKKLQAQLLAHAFQVSPNCPITQEQIDFINKNFHRKEFFTRSVNDEITKNN